MGGFSGFWLQVFVVHVRQLEEFYKTVKLLSVTPCVYVYPFLHPLPGTDEELAAAVTLKHQEEANLPVS